VWVLSVGVLPVRVLVRLFFVPLRFFAFSHFDCLGTDSSVGTTIGTNIGTATVTAVR